MALLRAPAPRPAPPGPAPPDQPRPDQPRPDRRRPDRGRPDRGRRERGSPAAPRPSAPAVRVVILDSRPSPMVPACGATWRARPWRPVHAVRPWRHPAPVRQPVPSRPRVAIGPAAGTPGIRPAVRRSTVGRSTVGRSTVGRSTVGGSTFGGAPFVGAPFVGAPWGPLPRGTTRHRARPCTAEHPRVARAACGPAFGGPPCGTGPCGPPLSRPAVRARPLRPGPPCGADCRAGSHCPVCRRRMPSSWDPAVAGASVRRRGPEGNVPRLARLRPTRLAHSRLPGRHVARSPQQLPVVVILGLGPAA